MYVYIYIYRRQSSNMHIDVMTCDDHVVSTSGLNNITLSTTCPPVGNCTCHVILGVAWSISPWLAKGLAGGSNNDSTIVNGSTQWTKRNFECQTLAVTYATSTPNHNLRKAPPQTEVNAMNPFANHQDSQSQPRLLWSAQSTDSAKKVDPLRQFRLSAGRPTLTSTEKLPKLTFPTARAGATWNACSWSRAKPETTIPSSDWPKPAKA